MVLALSKKEIKSAVWPALKVCLKKMGLHPCIAAEICHGPRKYLGVGLTGPFETQGTRRLIGMMEQIWHDTPTGKLLVSNLELLTVELGVFGHLFDQSNCKALSWAITPNAWVIASLLFAFDRTIFVDIHLDCLSPARHHDQSLMTAFFNRGLSEVNLQRLNRVRLWYRISRFLTPAPRMMVV